MNSGNISIIGKPNVGKSTLFNSLIKRHLAGETNKPQTTRHKIEGILFEENTEFLFMDTPGINFNIRKNFNRILNRSALSAIYESDVILHVINYHEFDSDDHKVIENIRNVEIPKILVLNKVDLDKKRTKLPKILSSLPKEITTIYNEVIPISSKKYLNISRLKVLIKKLLPETSEPLYGNVISNKPQDFFVEEYIREACIKFLSLELPYSLHVAVNTFNDEEELVSITSTIFLSKKSHLSIVVGKSGSMLVKISKYARINAEKLLEKKVFLKIHVKYDPKWKDTKSFLNSYN